MLCHSVVDHSVVGLFQVLFPGHSVVGLLLGLLAGHSVVDYSVVDLLFWCELGDYLLLGLECLLIHCLY